jgi:WD40 repeat protein
MAEACFSSNGSSSFIHISHDNRIHLWDTDTRKERRTYVEKQHLSHTYTCSSWRAGKRDNLGYFAVGTSDGTIILWDLTRGVVSKTLGKANESPVPTSVVFSNDSKSLLVSSSQNHIVQYDLSTGEESHTFKAGKKGVLKVAVNPKVEVVAAAG